MNKALSFLCRATQIILFFCMLGMTVTIVSLVITRYFFDFSPSWSEEITRFLMVWMVMLGGAVLTLFDDHITLYMFTEKLSQRGRVMLDIVVKLMVGGIAGITAWTGFKFAFSMANVIAPGTQWSMAIPTISVPIAFTLIVFFCCLLIIRDIMVLTGRMPMFLPEQQDYMYGSFRPIEHED